ncbi:MAG: GNAT family N-acetyltransferase [Pseudomonadota bacterium]
MRIREAIPQESNCLSALAFRSKGHWGYANEFMVACRRELTVEPSRLGTDDYQCFVAVDREEIIGFYTVERVSANSFELEALFVEPEHIGRGVGRTLIKDATRRVSALGIKRLIIQSDPHAAQFYIAAGAVEVGMRESGSVPGRQLPLFEITLATS